MQKNPVEQNHCSCKTNCLNIFPFGRLKSRCSEFSCSLLWTELSGTAKLGSLVVTALTRERKLFLVNALRIICWHISIRKASGVNNTRSKWIINFLLRWSLRKYAAGQFQRQTKPVYPFLTPCLTPAPETISLTYLLLLLRGLAEQTGLLEQIKMG